MKSILCLCAVAVGLTACIHALLATEPAELAVKRTESIDQVTGLKRGVMEEYTRDGTKVMAVIHLYKKGKWAASSRFTYAFGRSILQEGDEDADGFYELRIISPSDDPNTVEVFHIEKDGTLKPASSAKLKEYREYAKQMQEFGVFMRGEIEKAAQELNSKK
jgi:hypothetical protein